MAFATGRKTQVFFESIFLQVLSPLLALQGQDGSVHFFLNR